MAKLAIPETIRQQVEEIVEQFNKTELKGKALYAARFRGKHLYLDRTAYGSGAASSATRSARKRPCACCSTPWPPPSAR